MTGESNASFRSRGKGLKDVCQQKGHTPKDCKSTSPELLKKLMVLSGPFHALIFLEIDGKVPASSNKKKCNKRKLPGLDGWRVRLF